MTQLLLDLATVLLPVLAWRMVVFSHQCEKNNLLRQIYILNDLEQFHPGLARTLKMDDMFYPSPTRSFRVTQL